MSRVWLLYVCVALFALLCLTPSAAQVDVEEAQLAQATLDEIDVDYDADINMAELSVDVDLDADVDAESVADADSSVSNEADADAEGVEEVEDATKLPASNTLPVNKDVCWPSFSETQTYGWTKAGCKEYMRKGLPVGQSCSFGCRRGWVIQGKPIKCVKGAKGPRQQGKQHCVRVCPALPATALSKLPAGASLGTCASPTPVFQSCGIKCPKGTQRSGKGYRCANVNGNVKLIGEETCVPLRTSAIDDVKGTIRQRAARATRTSTVITPTSSAAKPAKKSAPRKTTSKSPRFRALEASSLSLLEAFTAVESESESSNTCINPLALNKSWDSFAFKDKYGFVTFVAPYAAKLLAMANLGLACQQESGKAIIDGKVQYSTVSGSGIIAQDSPLDVCKQLPVIPDVNYPLVAATAAGNAMCFYRQSESNTTTSWGVYVSGSIAGLLPAPMNAITAGGLAYSENRQLLSRDFTQTRFPPDAWQPLSCRDPANVDACRGNVWSSLSLRFTLDQLLPDPVKELLNTVKGNVGITMEGNKLLIDLDPNSDSKAVNERRSPFANMEGIGTLPWLKQGIWSHDASDMALMMQGTFRLKINIPFLPAFFAVSLQSTASLLVQYHTNDVDFNGLSRNGIFIPSMVKAQAIVGPVMTKIFNWLRSTLFFLPALETSAAGTLDFNSPDLKLAFWVNTRGAFTQATVNGVGIRIGLSTENNQASVICVLTDGKTCESVNVLQLISLGAKLIVNGVAKVGQAIGQAAQMIIQKGLTFIKRIGEAIANVIDDAGRLVGQLLGDDFDNNKLSNIKKVSTVPPRFKQIGRIAPEALTQEAYDMMMEESAAFRSFIEQEKQSGEVFEKISYMEEDSEVNETE